MNSNPTIDNMPGFIEYRKAEFRWLFVHLYGHIHRGRQSGNANRFVNEGERTFLCAEKRFVVKRPN